MFSLNIFLEKYTGKVMFVITITRICSALCMLNITLCAFRSACAELYPSV